MIRIREKPEKTQPPLADLLPDETLSSWVARQPGRVYETSDSRSWDLDFDTIELDLPTASANLKAKLRRAAMPPDPWTLPREWRTRYCPECRFVDWATGNPKYLRRSWAVAWRTCCPKHGPLADFDRGRQKKSLREVLTTRPWRNLIVMLNDHAQPYSRIDVSGDKRAVHLESALAADAIRSHTEWFPRGFTGVSLMFIYRKLVTALMDQLDLVPWGQRVASAGSTSDNDPLVVFERLPAIRQFGINVCAEAILAEWSQTPLPAAQALARRTQLIARVLGWSFRKARCEHPDTVLFGVRLQGVTPAPGILKALFATTSTGTDVQGGLGFTDFPLVWLTKEDAELLGWGFQFRCTASVITSLVKAGRLGSYDKKRGRLRQTPHPTIPLSEVELSAIETRCIKLPLWWEKTKKVDAVTRLAPLR